jgi:hypothetical protein
MISMLPWLSSFVLPIRKIVHVIWTMEVCKKVKHKLQELASSSERILRFPKGEG